MKNKLFTPIRVGDLDLEHRIVLEQPLSAGPDMKTRALVPLSISEIFGGLVIADISASFVSDPAAWKPTDSNAVELIGAKSAHNGKRSRQSVLARLRGDIASQIPDTRKGVAALSQRDLDKIIGEYADAAYRAKLTGYDGVELDGSFGTITERFLSASVNFDSGSHGAAMGQGLQFLSELVDAISPAFSRDRIGIRLSPFVHGIDSRWQNEVYDELMRSLHDQEIAYLHVEMTEQSVVQVLQSSPLARALRGAYPGILITSGQQGLRMAIELVESRWADAVCFPASEIDEKFLGEMRHVKQANSGL